MKKIKYDISNLQDFDREWLIHKGCKEWWYATGILYDEENNMYSFQYTLLHLNFKVITLKVAMIALTDYKNNRHYYLQEPTLGKRKIIVNEKEASFKNVCECKKDDDGIKINLKHKDFKLDVKANYGKGAIWHCDSGKLKMGIDGKKETTLYYSYTNMPTVATLQLNGKEIKLTGKTWFDKQGGPYSIQNTKTHWEWFSLRFFDGEEMMLFTFPQDNYLDGTYIRKDGSGKRLNNYKTNAYNVIEFDGLNWSSGWDLEIYDNDVDKDRHYKIEPLQEGHINFAYFEELCYIKNDKDEIVGYAFAELLPGIRNSNMGKMSKLLKRVET